jgi:ABC transporter substrate binding protein
VTIIRKELGAKRFELLKEAVPNVSRVGVLWDPSFSTGAAELKEIESAARSLGVGLQVMGVRHPEEFERAILAMTKQHVGALIVTPSLIFAEHRKRLADLSAKARLPMMSVRREIVETGGLMSYGPNFSNSSSLPMSTKDERFDGPTKATFPGRHISYGTPLAGISDMDHVRFPLGLLSGPRDASRSPSGHS